MPFTPPATYASKANIGYESVFFLGDLSSPPNYTAVAEIKSFKPDYATISPLDTTHLLSPLATEERIPSMIKPGTVEMTGNFIADSSQLALLPLAQSREIFPFKLTAPVQRNTATYTATGFAFISAYTPGPFEPNKPIEFSLKLEITGPVAESIS